MVFLEFALSLILTLSLEGSVALLWHFRGKNWLLFVLVNLLTNPLVVLFHAMFPGWPVLIVLEISAFTVEGLCYRAWGEKIPYPILFAALANLFSFGMGLVINLWI